MWKNSVAVVALRDRNTNNTSRQRGMPPLGLATTARRLTKKDVFRMSNWSPFARARVSPRLTFGLCMKPKVSVTRRTFEVTSSILTMSSSATRG
jgi:hypothetical protein